MQKWEYLIHDKGISPKALDDYCKEGWEMVGFTRTTDDLTMIFKRPLVLKPIEQIGARLDALALAEAESGWLGLAAL